MSDATVVIPRRALLAAILAAAALLAGAIVVAAVPRDALGRTLAPRAVAPSPVVDQQRLAAEHGIQRGYAKANDQLRQVRQLTLAITEREAVSIDAKARDDLRNVRADAVRALGRTVGLGGPSLEQYVTATAAQLDQGSFESEPGVLLAPDLFAIVRRAGELFQQFADNATRELTRAPATPSPTARATASPSGR